MQVYRLNDLSEAQRDKILKRSEAEFENLIPYVQEIMDDVRQNGDEALLRLTELHDRVRISDIAVADEEFDRAYEEVGDPGVSALKHAMRNLEVFHRTQLVEEEIVQVDEGIRIGRLNRPVEKVGIYIISGYTSEVLMNGVPSGIAGCKERVICTPPQEGGSVPASILVAADLVGVRRIFKVGGAQAIAAMTYGTETIPKVYKIFGAGNNYVTVAKMLAFGHVNIDLPAGPSEIFIIADESADARFVAADLISQAEHPNSACILITTSQALAADVKRQIDQQLALLPTKECVQGAIEKNGAIVIADDLAESIDFANAYAPEHLEIMTTDDQAILEKITNVGSVFLGPYSTVPAGDYASGSNHVLPTGGFAKMFSSLSVDSFIRKVEVQQLSKEGLSSIRKAVGYLADVEGFAAHKRAVEIRLEN